MATEAILAGPSLKTIVHDWNGRGITRSRGKAWTGPPAAAPSVDVAASRAEGLRLRGG